MPPLISVILPVYNCEKYISIAIESILQQTLIDFELIIINDGSNDGSVNEILKFTDTRIVYLVNEKNMGLIATLNRGIQMSKGSLIARMDADDISYPDRLMTQFQFLNNNTSISMVASLADFINKEGVIISNWLLDRNTITPNQIRKVMLYENCIVHPSIMIRSKIIKELQYNIECPHFEDYELWLRTLSSGYNISKINRPLIKYRVHPDSITGSILQFGNAYYSHSKIKMRIVRNNLFEGKVNNYTYRLLFASFIDLMKGTLKLLKSLFNS